MLQETFKTPTLQKMNFSKRPVTSGTILWLLIPQRAGAQSLIQFPAAMLEVCISINSRATIYKHHPRFDAQRFLTASTVAVGAAAH